MNTFQEDTKIKENSMENDKKIKTNMDLLKWFLIPYQM